MNYDYDIFISYGASEKAEQDTMNQWAVRFCEYLALVLNRLNNKELTFMLHDDLRSRTQLIGNNITEVFSKTAIFVTILSPEYSKSAAYLKELEQIYDVIYKGTAETARNINRIFKVITTPLPGEAQPESLLNEISYNFFEINKYNKKARSFEISEETGPEEKFWFKLVDLAYDIQSSLSILTSGANSNVREKQYVYLAETTFDQIENRDAIRRELQHLGLGILPLISLPDDAEKLEPLIQSYLKRSALSIHIMGAQYGDLIKNSKFSMIDYQNRVAKSFIENNKDINLSRLIWIPSDLKFSDQRQSLYINRLKRDDAQSDSEIVEAPAELFKTILQSKFTETNFQVKLNRNKPVVYLINEPDDNPVLKKYAETIERYGFELLESDVLRREPGYVTKHKKSLIEADMVIVYQGNSNKNWLTSKVQDLVKSSGFGKQKPFMAIVLIANDEVDEDILKFLPDTKVIITRPDDFSFMEYFAEQLKVPENVR